MTATMVPTTRSIGQRMLRREDPPLLTGESKLTNPLGVKGIGEAGTIGAAPAVINAVVDALSPYGVRDITMPATPQRVWHAIKEASK